MEFERWKFSTEVKTELEEFLKCVEDTRRNEENNEETNKIWKILLPKVFIYLVFFCYK